MHASGCDAPDDVRYVPAGHCEQFESPGAEEYVPAPQMLQVVAAASFEKDPGLHAAQTDGFMAPTVVEK
jgi:hypothetical protein